MCQVCQELVDKHLSGLSEEEKSYILWEETAFPFIDPREETGREMFEKQLIDARERGAKEKEACLNM